MKTYKITLLTSIGVIEEMYTNNRDLEEFAAQMETKYGIFVQISAKEVQ